MKAVACYLCIYILLFQSCINHRQVNSDRPTNQLIHESSPYLLQHAYNPVDWHPWGKDALKKAKDENKMLIISIGYAACHWCHVMEHESFEDSTVAAVMNEYFVPIKVDREERPDVDDIYMSAAQLVSGRGGWPLNAFALPDGRPVWAGTYFPKEQWLDILRQFADLQREDPRRLENGAEQLTAGINSLDDVIIANKQSYDSDDLISVTQRFLSQIDREDGGRRGAPKFPMPNNYEYLLDYGILEGDAEALNAVFLTLDKMALGGIYDHVGGGFARYSVDSIWKVPHFEKMLYDNAQLVSLYSKAYGYTKRPLYKRVVEQTLEFIERELNDPQGGFYSSLDADSEGEEGKFYVWTEAELANVLMDPMHLELAKSYYSTTSIGNWEHGTNILHVNQDPADFAAEQDMFISQLFDQIDEINDQLLMARSDRVRPGLDDKTLTSWNALMIQGYVDAYQAMGKKEYLQMAEMKAHFLLREQLSNEGRLNRNYKAGRSSINGFLDDYALVIQALLSLYEVTFDESWVNVSTEIMDYAIAHFMDDKTSMFFYTSDLDPALVARKKELSDNVIPASNSVMARVLQHLGELTYNKAYLDPSAQMLANMWPTIREQQQPSFYSNWMQLLLGQVHPPYEVAIMGDQSVPLAHEMMTEYRPDVMYLGSYNESVLPLLENKFVPDQTVIYVCQNKVCKFPVETISQAKELMNDEDR